MFPDISVPALIAFYRLANCDLAASIELILANTNTSGSDEPPRAAAAAAAPGATAATALSAEPGSPTTPTLVRSDSSQSTQSLTNDSSLNSSAIFPPDCWTLASSLSASDLAAALMAANTIILPSADDNNAPAVPGIMAISSRYSALLLFLSLSLCLLIIHTVDRYSARDFATAPLLPLEPHCLYSQGQRSQFSLDQ